MSRKLGLTIIAAALITVYGCGKEEPKKAAEAPKAAAPAAPAEEVVTVKIGHAGPLTGGIAHLGKDDENGARLAVDEHTARKMKIGGKTVKFELMSEDDQADPKMGPTIAQKFADAKVAGVAGHLNSGVSIPASAVYNQAGIPMISGSATNPKLTEQGFKTIFRTVGRDDQQGPAIAQYLNNMKIKKVAIADDATAYGEGLANEVEKTLKAAGVQVVAREKATDKTTDFKAILTKMKGKAPDAIFYGGMDATGGPMIKQARELGIKSVFSFGDGACTDEMAKLAGAAAEGLICSQAGLPASAASQSFNDAFKAKYGEVKQYAPFFYDAVGIMIAAMQKADSTDPAKYVPEISEDQVQRRDGHDRVRREGRPQERRDHDLHAEGRQGHAGRRRQGRQGVDVRRLHEGNEDGGGPRGCACRGAGGDARPGPGHATLADGSAQEVSAAQHKRRRLRAPFLFACAHRASARIQSPGRQPTGRSKGRALDIFLQQIINGLTLGSVYAIVALGLHDGVRDHPAHQLRARRGRDDRRDGRVHGHRRADQREHGPAPDRRRARRACWPRFPCAWRSATRWSASRTGRCAVRRGSPRSSPRSACRSSCSTWR